MIFVLVAFLAGYLHLAEAPACRVDPRVSVDSRCLLAPSSAPTANRPAPAASGAA